MRPHKFQVDQVQYRKMTLSHFILFSSLEHTFTVRIKWWFHVSVVNQVRVYQDDHKNSLSTGSSVNKTRYVDDFFGIKLSSSSFFPQKMMSTSPVGGFTFGSRSPKSCEAKILPPCQWPFQDPKLEVYTIYKAYFVGLCKGISPPKMALYGTNVPP